MNWDWLLPLPLLGLLATHIFSAIRYHIDEMRWFRIHILTPEFNIAMGALRRWAEEGKLPKTLDLLVELEVVTKGDLEILRALGEPNGYYIYRMIKARQKQSFWRRLWNRK